MRSCSDRSPQPNTPCCERRLWAGHVRATVGSGVHWRCARPTGLACDVTRESAARASIRPNRFVYCPDLGSKACHDLPHGRRNGDAGGRRPRLRRGRVRTAAPGLPVVNELDSTVVAFARDPASGALRALQTVHAAAGVLRGEHRGRRGGASCDPVSLSFQPRARQHRRLCGAGSGRGPPGYRVSGGRTPCTSPRHPGSGRGVTLRRAAGQRVHR